MYVRNGARFTGVLAKDRWAIAALLVLALITEWLDLPLDEYELVSVVYVGIFSTALSIFLVFRFNEAYERWWEARKLWGTLVNRSRDMARQALTLLPAGTDPAVGRRLVHRHIAYVHALRFHLGLGPGEECRRRTAEMLAHQVPDEAPDYPGHHVPNELLQRQSEDLVRVLATEQAGVEGRVILERFDTTLMALQDVQGGCERIRNTAFPDGVILMTRVLVWGLVVLLMLSTIGPDGDRGGWFGTLLAIAMSMGFVAIESMGRDLNDPFDDQPNVTAMHALSVTIERDLRSLLGETELPAPVEPEDGVLR